MRGARRALCQAKKTGKIEEKVARDCNQANRKEEEKSAILHNTWKQKKAMVPRKVGAHCSVVRLVSRREGRGA